MTPERLQQIEEIFHSALALEPGRRADFLARVCDGDDALRGEVESLLRSHGRGESFIEQPAADIAAELLAGGRPGLEPGRRLGHYEIKGLLGEGGMGEVYLAEDARLGRPVALKLLPPQFMTDADRTHRFEREARAASALNHPNIVTIHEIGQAGPLHFIATEFVDGETLRERMTTTRMSICEVLDVAAQVASALQAAHEAGIVHRDIKPENIMLRRDGLVKVLDFGLAKLASPRAAAGAAEAPTQLMTRTNPGVVMGTAAYMSPEQARGLAVDERTDVWSLGVLLYEMVAGRQPFDGATPTDVIISIAEREPARLAGHAPEVPARLERIVEKALAKDRGGRYQAAEGLLTDLKGLRRELELGAEAGRSRQAVTPDESAATTGRDQVTASRRPPLRVRRGRVPLVAGLAGVLVATGLVSWLLFRRSPAPAPQTEIRSLAVLPLENLSGDSSQDYFADGMTEALITDLAKVGALQVMSRPSVMPYKGARKPLPEERDEEDEAEQRADNACVCQNLQVVVVRLVEPGGARGRVVARVGDAERAEAGAEYGPLADDLARPAPEGRPI